MWHSGEAAAFNSILVRLAKRGVSFAVLCNAGEFADRGDHERPIAKLFLPPRPATPATAASPIAAEVAAADVSDKAGLFFSERTGDPLRLLGSDGTLRIAGGPVLVTLGKDRFRNARGNLRFMSQDEFELRFLSSDQLELRSMEGRITRYRRAQPYAPSPAELAAFSGRYATDEVGLVEVTPGNAGVSARLNASPSLEFAPVDRDVFQRGATTIRFRRDAAGQVIALDLTTQSVRNLRFTRRSAGTEDPPDTQPTSRLAPLPGGPPPAPAEPAAMDLRIYEGTYGLQAPARVIDLRVLVDAQGRLNGELVGRGQQTTFRAGGPHRLLHAERDDIWFQFTVENGRATAVTMHQRGREISGSRKS